MPRIFKKKLHLCSFKINCLPTYFSPSLTLENDDDHNHHDYDNILITNKNNNINKASIIINSYNSVYDDLYPTTLATTTTMTTTTSSSVSSSSSSSTSDAMSTEDSSTDETDNKLIGCGVPVRKYSSDPYDDFRRSMLEMIEARESEICHRVGDGILNDDVNDWDFFQELLVSYLALNPKTTHEYIIRAFSDVVVSLVLDRP
ncbi:hypothetical protein vseg_015012 [Gypsophila vaccaria]